jgi:hypothetical protein
MQYRLVAPDGTPIRGTVENLPATAYINVDSVTQKEDGTYDFEWSGTTECWWDAQETATRDGQRLFDDENGNEWPENELVLESLYDDEDDEDAEDDT